MNRINLRPDDESWYATVDAAVRAAMRVPLQAIDYGAVSTRDNGAAQRRAMVRRLEVLACLNCLEERQRMALVLRAHGASWAAAARGAGLRQTTARVQVEAARSLVAERLRSMGLMEPTRSGA